MKIVYLLLLGFVTYCNAFPGGAPPSACAQMTPSHGVSAQTGAAPVTITVSASSYTVNSTLTG